jgi:hypothetical protein
MTRVFSNPSPPGDELDVLLGSFFKGEMPDPWPACRPAEEKQTLALNGRAAISRRQSLAPPMSRMLLSRLALAASIGLLLVAGLLLGGKLTPTRNTALPPLVSPEADTSKRFDPMAIDPRPKTLEKAKTASPAER